MNYVVRYSKELRHHGIQGQKWGQRNGPPYPLDAKSMSNSEKREDKNENRSKNKNDEKDGTSEKKFFLSNLSPEQKKAIKTGAIIVGAALVIGGGAYIVSKKGLEFPKPVRYMFGTPLKDVLDMYPDNPVSLKKGTKFQRLSKEATEDYTKRGEAYVSHLLGDNAKYVGMIGTDRSYVHTLKSNVEIKAPSERDAAKIFLNLNPDTDQANYQKFMNNAFMYDKNGNQNPAKQKFVQAVKDAGYNAIIDSNDSGWTKSPLILLDPANTVSSGRTHKLNAAERVIAEVLR